MRENYSISITLVSSIGISQFYVVMRLLRFVLLENVRQAQKERTNNNSNQMRKCLRLFRTNLIYITQALA